MPLSRRAAFVALLLAGSLAVAGCSATEPSDASPSAETRTIETVYGDVEVPASPERVAAVSYDTPWQLKAIDIQPIATIDYSRWLDSYTADQQAFVADAQTIGTFGEVNFEAVAAAKPDLIIGDAFEVDEATFARLNEIAPTVIVKGETRGDWQSLTEQTAEATGRTAEWEAGKDAYEKLRDETKATYADVIENNTWIKFSLGNEAGQFSVQLPTGSTGNLVVNELGMQYGPGAQLEDTESRGYASLPVEQLPAVFDGVTFALTSNKVDGSPYEEIQTIIDSEIFQTLDVAKTDSIYGVRTQVTDYVTAQQWINELVENVLEPLSK